MNKILQKLNDHTIAVFEIRFFKRPESDGGSCFCELVLFLLMM